MHTKDYVGIYKYRKAYSLDDVSLEWEDFISANHDGDSLILKPSGEYFLIQGGTTKTISESKGQWRLVLGAYPSISLGLHGYPIQVKKER